jgi:hypothetical protein
MKGGGIDRLPTLLDEEQAADSEYQDLCRICHHRFLTGSMELIK